jgi:hypothetical protein
MTTADQCPRDEESDSPVELFRRKAGNVSLLHDSVQCSAGCQVAGELNDASRRAGTDSCSQFVESEDALPPKDARRRGAVAAGERHETSLQPPRTSGCPRHHRGTCGMDSLGDVCFAVLAEAVASAAHAAPYMKSTSAPAVVRSKPFSIAHRASSPVSPCIPAAFL